MKTAKTGILMKKSRLSLLAILLAVISCGAIFTSCDNDDPWDGPGPNAFYDNRLEGTWELYQANGHDVGPADTNYLYFNGDGRGTYYYLRNGREYSEPLAYFCQESLSPSSYYQINLRYGNDAPVTMSYWFTDRGYRLWLSWLTDSGTITYCYRPYQGYPW